MLFGSQGGSICQGTLPQIKVTFSDGYYEYFNRVTVTYQTLTQTYTSNGTKVLVPYISVHWNSSPPTSYPWFSKHMNPQVAIALNKEPNSAYLTFYVSV
jgi:hypothetical protein